MAYAFCLCLMAMSVPCGPAHAVMITLEPDDYAVGTNVTTLFEGVTLQMFSGQAGISTTYRDVYVESWPSPGNYAAATGTQTFGIFTDPMLAAQCWSGPCGTSGDPFSALLIQFDRPTNYVEISASWLSDAPALIGYGINGKHFLTYSPSSVIRPYWEPSGAAAIFELGGVHSESMIQAIIVAGVLGNSNIDRIRYNSVPEPSSVLLLAAGLAGAAIWRRRQTQ